MHIIIIYQYFLQPGEAGHSRVNEYAQLWSEMGHKVSVISGQGSYMTGRKDSKYNGKLCARESAGNVNVFRCYVPDHFNRSFFRRSFSYLSFAISSAYAFFRIKKGESAVLLVSSPPLTVGFGALFIKLFSKIPMLFEVRDLWPESAITTGALTSKWMIRLLFWLEKSCYGKAAMINTLTPAFKENILSRGLKASSDIRSIPCGVDIEEFHPDKRSTTLRDDLGWTGKKVILYTGAMGRANNVSQLIDVARLLKHRTDILIAIVGSGMDADAVSSEIRSEGLENIVYYGSKPREEMSAIVASADICTAVLMRNDTFKTVFPNKVFDYMACKKPIILCIDGIIRDLVERIGCGEFSEPENPQDFMDKLEYILDTSGKLDEMGEKGRGFVENEFDRNMMAERYEKLFEELTTKA